MTPQLPHFRELTRLWMLRIAGLAYRRPHGLAQPRSLLLIRPDHLGDMLFLTPALHGLRLALPSSRITVLCGPWSEAVLAGNPDVDEVRTCRFPAFERQPKASLFAPYRYLYRSAAELRAGGYDAAVIFRFDHWWGAWLAAAAGIPRRIGYEGPETAPFLTQALPYTPDRHEVLQNLGLVQALAPGALLEAGPTCFTISAGARAWAVDWVAQQGSGQPHRLVAIHPGAGALVKQWPVEAWVQVAQTLAQDRFTVIVLTGAASERGLAAEIASRLGCQTVNLAGETSLVQLAALYERCSLVLGSDSGPLHLAVAVGTPTVHLHGPVSETKFGPWGDPARHIALVSDWPCVPCNRLDWPAGALPAHRCMDGIRPAQVLAAARRLLD